MSTHWASSYIGKPWQRSAAGPDAFDCWGLVRAVQAAQFGHELPAMPLVSGSVLETARLMRDHPERQRWQPVPVPAQGDLGLLCSARHPSHCGIWLDVDGGGLLHSAQGLGVVFQPLNVLRLSGWGRFEWLRFAGGPA